MKWLQIIAAIFFLICGGIGVTEAMAETGPGQTGATGEEPTGQAPGESRTVIPQEEVFGLSGGWVHPFVSATELYSDNVYRTADNKLAGYTTIFSPGVWLSLPSTREFLLDLNTNSYTPGGINMHRKRQDFFRRFQTYLNYNAEIEENSRSEAEDFVSHRLEAFGQLNLRGGISLELIDQFRRTHDARGTGVSQVQLSKYDTNLTNFVFTSELGERLRFRTDFAYFMVDYQDKIDDYRDRDDQAFSWYLFFKTTPKTSAFGEYEFVVVDYKDDQGITMDNQEHRIYGGFLWDITAKSTGAVKVGYAIKEYASSTIDNAGSPLVEIRLSHWFTLKSSATLFGSIKFNEADIQDQEYVLDRTVSLGWAHEFTRRLTGRLNLTYSNRDYNSEKTAAGLTQEQQDDIYTLAPALEYTLTRWLLGSGGYTYSRRDSNFADFDFIDNTVFLRLTASL